MAETAYNFDKDNVIVSKLIEEIQANASITTNLRDNNPVQDNGNPTPALNLTIVFVDPLSGPEVTALNSTVSAHPLAENITYFEDDRDPLPTDDASGNYIVGSYWNNTQGEKFIATNVSIGAANWEKVLDKTQFLRFSGRGYPNGAAEFYLNVATDSTSSRNGDVYTAGGTLVGIAVKTNEALTESYDLQFVSNPGGSETILATLSGFTGSDRAEQRNFSASLSSLTEYGLKMIRTSASGDSSFSRINAIVEIRINSIN